MKVLIFTSQIYALGGAERLAVELAESLAAYPNIEVNVLSMAPKISPASDKTVERLLESGVSSVRFLDRLPGSGLSNIFTFIWQLRKILIEENYDIIETSLLGPTTITSWAVRGLHTQHIAGIHDIYKKSLHNDYMSKFWRWSCYINTKTSYYAISREATYQWVKFSSVRLEKVRIIYNSIHSLYYRAKSDRAKIINELNLEPDTRLVLFVGRLMLRKGLDTLIESMRFLSSEDKVSLLIVGYPNEKIETYFGETEGFLDKLKQESEADCKNIKIHWLGKRDDIPRLMASSDILVHPARHEGFGLVLAEALATGLPIVATKVGGIPEVLCDTDSILVSPGDPRELYEAICKVFQRMPAEAEIARIRGLARAEFFQSERRTKDLLEYFQDVIDQKR